MKTSTLLTLATVLLTLGGDLSRAQFMDASPSATPILGLNQTGSYGTTGIAYVHNGTLSKLDDGTTASPTLSTTADTYYASNDHTGIPDGTVVYNSSYVGFTFATPTVNAVSSLTVNFYLFQANGGWFGRNAAAPPPGGTLATYLVEPTLQYTTDGTTWQTLADTSDYISSLQGVSPSTDNGSEYKVTFTVTNPISGLEGIRVIGTSGGTTGTAHGFLGVADERVFEAVPEPSTFAMLLGGSVLLVALRLRKSVSQA